MMLSQPVRFVISLFCFLIFSGPILALLISTAAFAVVRTFLGFYLKLKHRQHIEFIDGYSTFPCYHFDKADSMMRCVFTFKGATSFHRVKEMIQNRLTDSTDVGKQDWKHPKLRLSIAESMGYFYWLPERHFTIDNHVKFHEGSPPKNLDQLLSLFESVPMTDFKANGLSPWLISYAKLDKDFDGLSVNSEPHFVLLIQIHHTLMDGVGMFTLLGDCLFQKRKNIVSQRQRYTKPTNDGDATGTNSSFITICNMLRNIFHAPSSSLRIVMKNRDSNRLHGAELNGKQHLVLPTPLSLNRLKKIKIATKTTINDIFISCIASAIHRYFTTTGDKTVPISVTISIPFSFRDVSADPYCTNRISVMFIQMPMSSVRPKCPLDWIETANDNVNRVKSSNEAWVIRQMFRTYNYIPSWCNVPLLKQLHTTCTTTNVSILTEEYYLEESTLVNISVYPQLRGKTGIGFGFILLNGKVQVCVSMDTANGTMEDTAKLANCFENAFVELEMEIETKKVK